MKITKIYLFNLAAFPVEATSERNNEINNYLRKEIIKYKTEPESEFKT